MSFKSKAIGIIAGAALTLSIASGAMAETTPSASTSATLTNKADGSCYVSASSGSINLGTWVWNGVNSYTLVPSSTSGQITFEVDQSVRPSDVNCRVTVAVSDLDEDGDGTAAIPASAIALSAFSGANGSGLLYDVTTPSNSGRNLVLQASLNSVPNNIPQGNYSGTVTVSNSASTN